MTFGSLFTGIGGLDLGLVRAGLECRWQVEKDAWCRKVLHRHWPSVARYGDICELSGKELEPVDFIVGGDPCQANSNAARFGNRSVSLGGEFIRLVSETKPRFVLRENPSVVRWNAPWHWKRFAGELENLGYEVLPFRLRACCVGLAHRRERLFLFAHLPHTDSARSQGHVGGIMAQPNPWRHHANVTGPNRRCPTPRVCGRPHGIPNRMDRLRALGNAVCPDVAEWIGHQILTGWEK